MWKPLDPERAVSDRPRAQYLRLRPGTDDRGLQTEISICGKPGHKRRRDPQRCLPQERKVQELVIESDRTGQTELAVIVEEAESFDVHARILEADVGRPS